MSFISFRSSPLVSLVSIIFTASALSAASASAGQVLDRLEASVNSSTILLSEIEEFRKTLPLRAQLDPLFSSTDIAQKGASASNREIVEFLIAEKIILQSFPVSDSEVEQEVNSIQVSNNVSRQGLRKALKEQGFDFEDYFELIRISAAKRNLIDREIRTKVTVSEEDVKNYYFNKIASGGSGPKSYRLKLISVSPANYKSASAAKEVAQRALQQVRSGEPFDEVARRISDDSSASSGGDLGLIHEDQLSDLFKKEARKMKIGDVSGVLGSANSGFFILKLADISTNQGQKQYEKMKDEIRARLTGQEYQRQISLWLERKKNTAYVHRAGEPTIATLNQSKGK